MSKVLLVTGGGRGIGAATCRLAAARGWAVAVNYAANAAAAEAVVAEIGQAGGVARAFQADVADEAAVDSLFDAVTAAFGPIGALVNSAGVGGLNGRVQEFDAPKVARMLAVNVLGTMLCCRAAARRMSTAHGGAGGAIVNLSSMAATIGGRAGSAIYAASKAAVDVYTVGLAKELAPQGIRVNAVRPGVTITDMTAGATAAMAATIPMNRFATADEVAAPILWLLSDEASFIAGARLDASGGGFLIS